MGPPSYNGPWYLTNVGTLSRDIHTWMSGGCLPTKGAINPCTPPSSNFRSKSVALRLDPAMLNVFSPVGVIESFTMRGFDGVASHDTVVLGLVGERFRSKTMNTPF